MLELRFCFGGKEWAVWLAGDMDLYTAFKDKLW